MFRDHGLSQEIANDGYVYSGRDYRQQRRRPDDKDDVVKDMPPSDDQFDDADTKNDALLAQAEGGEEEAEREEPGAHIQEDIEDEVIPITSSQYSIQGHLTSLDLGCHSL